MTRTYEINTVVGSTPVSREYIVLRADFDRNFMNRTKLNILLDTNETTVVTLSDGTCLSVTIRAEEAS